MVKAHEIWKDIPGYEGFYKISSFGNIKSLPRLVKRCNSIYPIQGRNVKTHNHQGYLKVGLSKNGVDTKYLVHRLVALAFIPNLYNKPYINHINSQPSDNRVENLEWCTQSENNFHAYRFGRKLPVRFFLGKKGALHHQAKKCLQYDLSGNFIKEWGCLNDIEREINIAATSIGGCCSGRLKTAGGFVWKLRLKGEME